MVSFLSKLGLADKTTLQLRFATVAREFSCQVSMGCPSFLSRSSYCLLVCLLFCILRTWLGNSQVGEPQNMTEQKCRLHPCVARVLRTMASSWELSKAFFLLVIFGSGCGSWERNVLCTLLGEAFCFQGVVKYCQDYLLFVPAET